VIEVRISAAVDPMASRCFFCGAVRGAESEPDPMQMIAYEDGECTGYEVCGTCRFLSDAERRAALRAHIERLIDVAVMLKAAVEGPIEVPPFDTLVLEHWWRQSETPAEE
jgi:hypothetical protein